VTIHAAPVPEGTPVIVDLADGHAGRWIDANDPAGAAVDDRVSSRVPCSLYKPGHRVHMIQANNGMRTPSTTYALLAVDGNELVVADDDGLTARWWVHDTYFARVALLRDERPVIHLHGLGLARIGSTLFYPHRDPSLPAEPCAWNSPSDLAANGGGFIGRRS
jgi:hypothetical protein